MNVNRFLDAAADRISAGDPAAIAMSFGGRNRLTYHQLRDKSLRYAAALRALGLTRGDRLGLMLFNDVEYLPLYFAAMRLGVITVRINFRLAPAELEFILADSGCRAVIVHGSLAEKVEPIRDATGVRTFIVKPDTPDSIPLWAEAFEILEDRDPIDATASIAPDDPIALIYTSGTTGRPKGAVWTHRNTVGTATMQALRWQFSQRTVALVPGPLYHGGGFEAVLAPALLMGGRAVYMESGNFSVDRLLEVIREERVTDCLVFSFMFNDLLRYDDLEDRLSDSLEHIIIGGDTMMPWVVGELRRRLPRVRLTQVYGLTEGGAVATTLEDEFFDSQPKSVGRPLPLAEVKVVDETGAEIGIGEEGEIWVRSPGVCAGYWQRPEANRETFSGGWCRTGDLGYVNADGFLVLAGRAKDMIRSGGENVYPAEIEKVLTGFPGIGDAAVIGVPDSTYNEVGCAVIVRAGDAVPDPDELRTLCRSALASYKIPKYFVYREELPRNASGKVLKYLLRAEYEKLEKEM
ncbi:class I adenylate-forming enzyme family protein [Nocardia nova]|uniref:class I adenylate-forming enzyme family protein n=1 Tax=Nocardia nova TaxID=37330 RepID=UPI00340EA4E6